MHSTIIAHSVFQHSQFVINPFNERGATITFVFKTHDSSMNDANAHDATLGSEQFLILNFLGKPFISSVIEPTSLKPNIYRSATERP